jgi:hypothetical protein
VHNPHRLRRTFAILFGSTTIACLSVVALFNYLMDPYAIFGVKTMAGVNAIKPRPDAMLGDIKYIVGSRFRPDALILGNSRAEVGFDPSHSAFTARHMRGFNAAVPGTGIDDAADAFQRFEGTTHLQFAIIGIDFLDFLYSPDTGALPPPTPSSDASSTRAKLLALFSTTALADSIKTLRIQRQQNPATLRGDGFNPMLDYREIAATEGYSALFRQRAQESARNLARRPHNLDVGGRRVSPSFSALRTILRTAAENGTEVALVIYPYHLLLLSQFEDAGLWPLFEQWKEDVAAISDEARQNGGRVVLWDFACPNGFTAEAIPAEGDRKSAMQWYWEGGHFKKELGDRVLARVLREAEATDAFGLELTLANVRDRNRSCREDLRVMRDRLHPLMHQASDLAKSTGARN